MKNCHSIKMKGLRTMMNELFPADDEATRKAWEILRENVDRGEKFLDKERPGWYKKVDLSNLQMHESDKCICGWVFKDMVGTLFDRGVLSRRILSGFEHVSYEHPTIGTAKYGFLADPAYVVILSNEQQYSMLAELWTEKIQKRLANDGLMT